MIFLRDHLCFVPPVKNDVDRERNILGSYWRLFNKYCPVDLLGCFRLGNPDLDVIKIRIFRDGGGTEILT